MWCTTSRLLTVSTHQPACRSLLPNAQMRTDHQEAMAHGVLNIMGENYEALERVFKGMGVLDTSKPDLRRPGVDEPFALAIQRCMTGGESGGERGGDEAAGAAEAGAVVSPSEESTKRKKLVQDADGADRRRAFGQLYEELSELAFKCAPPQPLLSPRSRSENPCQVETQARCSLSSGPDLPLTHGRCPCPLLSITADYFTIPSYYVLVMRAFVTLEGIALSADDDDSFNMYAATAPYARRKLLTPRTQGGRTLLKAALLSRDGRRAMRAGLRLPRPVRAVVDFVRRKEKKAA